MEPWAQHFVHLVLYTGPSLKCLNAAVLIFQVSSVIIWRSLLSMEHWVAAKKALS
jgi:hypothetical protein